MEYKEGRRGADGPKGSAAEDADEDGAAQKLGSWAGLCGLLMQAQDSRGRQIGIIRGSTGGEREGFRTRSGRGWFGWLEGLWAAPGPGPLRPSAPGTSHHRPKLRARHVQRHVVVSPALQRRDDVDPSSDNPAMRLKLLSVQRLGKIARRIACSRSLAGPADLASAGSANSGLNSSGGVTHPLKLFLL